MEGYKERLKRRLAYSVLFVAAVLTVIVLAVTGAFPPTVPDFVLDFNTGFCGGVLIVALYNIAKAVVALRNAEKLKKCTLRSMTSAENT